MEAPLACVRVQRAYNPLHTASSRLCCKTCCSWRARPTAAPRLGGRLAPLAVCLPTVVAEFGRLARRWRLADCAPPAPAACGAAGPAAGGLRPLEMFFPFDPYLLRRSAAVLDLKCVAAPPAGRAARVPAVPASRAARWALRGPARACFHIAPSCPLTYRCA